jgi:ribosomal protein S18 acetylase RimI-like enzyme
VNVRQYALSDYDAVFSFWQSIGEGLGLGPSDTREEITHKVERDADLFLLAEDGGRIVGTIIGGYDGRRGMIYHLAVAPEQRNRGLGGSLLAEVETRLCAKGCYKSYLLILRDNVSAIAFYEARGWSDMSGRVTIMGKVLADDTK